MTGRRRAAQSARGALSGHAGATNGTGALSTAPVAVPGAQRLVMEDFPSPVLARTLSPNGRAHWGVRRKARLEVETRVALAMAPAVWAGQWRALRGRVRATFRFVRPTRGRIDLDNLTTGVTKACLDALVRGGWLDDDDSEHVVSVTAEVDYQRGRRALEIILEPVREARP